MIDNSKIIEIIKECEDRTKLKNWIANARAKGADDVEKAAYMQLISIVPGEKPGTVEHEFWKTIHAFEQTLSEERKKTTRLSRTRQKINRVGVIQTMKDLALKNKESEGFKMLMERGMPELTAEAIILRFQNRFDSEVILASRDRLQKAGVDIDHLL